MEPNPNKDPNTPKGQEQEKQNSPPKSPEQKPELATSRVEENVINQIEGHSITTVDHRGREHILYNLPNLNSLPEALLKFNVLPDRVPKEAPPAS